MPAGTRTAIVIVAFMILFAGIPFAPFPIPVASALALQASEDWSSPAALGSWAVTGAAATVDCITTQQGCTLRVDPSVTTGSVSVKKQFAGLEVGAAPWYISTYYRATSTASQAKYVFNVTTNHGYFGIDFTGGPNRNQIILFTHNETSEPIANLTAGAWYQANISVDAVEVAVRAKVYDSSGNEVGGSRELPGPLTKATDIATGSGDGSSSEPMAMTETPSNIIEAITFHSTRATSDTLSTPVMNFDTLRLFKATPPTAARNLTAVPGPGVGEISLSWSPPADDGGSPVTHYDIYAGNSTQNMTLAAQTPLTSWRHTGLQNGETNDYAVRAVNIVGSGSPSATVNATTYYTPSAPQNVSATPGAHTGEIELRWTRPVTGGAAANLTYDIYRAPLGSTPILVHSVEDQLSLVDAHLQNGTSYQYAIRARNPADESGPSDPVTQIPAPDAVEPPTALLVAPERAWSMDPRSLSFTYDLTISECPEPAICPVESEWRAYLDATMDGTPLQGDPIASGTTIHPGHAETLTIPVLATITPVGEGGEHTITVAVTTRAGSTTWQTATTPIWIQSPIQGVLVDLTPPTLDRVSSPVGGNVSVASGYTVFHDQCAAASECPVANDWQIRLAGGSIAPEGALLARGTNHHPAHGTNETYTITANVTIPDVSGGAYEVIVAARHSDSGPWHTTSVPLHVETCAAQRILRTTYWQPDDAPTSTQPYSRVYVLEAENHTNLAPLTFHNACDPSEAAALLDQDYEIGRGGALLGADAVGGFVFASNPSKTPVAFLVASDLDDDGKIRDDGTDCLEGPFVNLAPINCTLDPQGHVLLVLLDDPHNPYQPDPHALPINPDPQGTNFGTCPRPQDCFHLNEGGDGGGGAGPVVPQPPTLYELDAGQNGYGDPWERKLGDDLMAQVIMYGTRGDPDDDGLSNIDEFRWLTIPVNAFSNARDYDEDEWLDGPEVYYWTDADVNRTVYFDSPIWKQTKNAPTEPAAFNPHYHPGSPPPSNTTFTRTTVHNPDVDGDGLKDGFENNTLRSYPEFADSDCHINATVCDAPGPRFHKGARNTMPANGDPGHYHDGEPGTGDGINDYDEDHKWEQFNGKLVYPNNGTTITLARNADFDHDGISNNLLDPDSDGDGLLDGTEFNCQTPNAATANLTCTKAYTPDSDADGLLDGNDLTITSGDPRYELFKTTYNILYIQTTSQERRFLGEATLGTDPNNPCTRPTPQPCDRPYAEEVHPNAVRDVNQLAVTKNPTNQDFTEEEMDPTAHGWLVAGTEDYAEDVPSNPEEINAFIEGGLSAAKNFTDATLSHLQDVVDSCTSDPSDPEGAAMCLATGLTQDVWVVNSTEDLVDCAQEALEGQVQPSLFAPTLECVTGVVQSVVSKTLDALSETPLDPVVAKPLELIENITSDLSIDRVPFLEPLLPPVARQFLENDPNDLPGSMPKPPAAPWPEGVDTNSTPFDFSWNQTPFPSLTGDVSGPLFSVVSDFQRNHPGTQFIGTIDATTFIVYATDASHPRVIRPTCPIASFCPVNLDDPGNSTLTNADFHVKVEWILLEGTQAPKVTVQNARALQPLDAFIAAFVQVPNTNMIIALGNDGTTHPQPSTFDFALGTNALQRAIHGAELPAYSFEQHTTGLNPMHLMASLILVDQTTYPKQPIEGERADARIDFTQAPASATAILRETSRSGGMDIGWNAVGATPSVTVRTRAEHAGTSSEASVSLASVPPTFRTNVVKEDEFFRIVHTSPSGTSGIGNITATWNGSAATQYRGGFTSVNVPTSVTLTIDPANKTASFTASAPLGRTRLAAYESPLSATMSPPCAQPTGEYLLYAKTPTGTCATANITGLQSMSANWQGNMQVSVTRADHLAQPFTFSANVGKLLTITSTSWPTRVDFTYTKTPTQVQVTSELSSSIGWLNMTYDDPTGPVATLVARDLPRQFTTVADYPTGIINVTSTTSGPIGDISFHHDDGFAGPLDFGDDDAVALVGNSPTMHGAAIRLRNFSWADLRVNFTTGLALKTSHASSHPFHLRWQSGDNQLSANLPRLPKDVYLGYNMTPAAFDLQYRASEKIDNSAGNFLIADGRATLSETLTDFPKSLDIGADFATGRIHAWPSSPIAFAEVQIASPDRFMRQVPWTNHLLIDQLDAIQVGDMQIPRFHAKITNFGALHANITERAVEVKASFNTTNAGTLSVHYNGTPGWLYANVTTNVPSEFNLSVGTSGARWTATSPMDTDGAAKFTNFTGSWRIKGLPTLLNAAWTSSNSVYTFDVEHSATTFPLLDFTGMLRVLDGCPGTCPASLIHILTEDLPAKLSGTADSARGLFEVKAMDANGDPARAKLVEAAFVADATLDYPKVAQSGSVAFVRLVNADLGHGETPGLVPQEFFLRLDGISSVAASTKPDPLRGGRMWFEYIGANQVPATLDIADDAGNSLYVHTPRIARDLVGSYLPTSQGPFALDVSASHDMGWTFRWHNETLEASGSGTLPAATETTPSLHAEKTDRGVVFRASAPMSAQVSIAPPGTGKAPQGWSGDHFVGVVTPDAPPNIALSFQGIELVRVDTFLTVTIVNVTGASPRDVYLDLQDTANQFSIRGTIEGMAASGQLGFSEYGASWVATSATSEVDVDASAPQGRWRIDATQIPSDFTAWIDLAGQHGGIESFDGTAFGSVFAGFTNTAGPIPGIEAQGFVVDAAGASSVRLAAKLDGFTDVSFSWGDTVRANMQRIAGATSGPFAGQLRTPDVGFDVTLTNLPEDLELAILSGPTTSGTNAYLNASSDIGSAGLLFTSKDGDMIDMSATGIPSKIHFEVAPSLDATGNAVGLHAGYSMAAGATDAQLWGNVTTSDGWRAVLALDEIPISWTLDANPTEGDLRFHATGGAFSGKAWAGKPGTRAYTLPDRLGASLVLDPNNPSAWLNVEGLTDIWWSHSTASDLIELTFDAPRSEAIYVHYDGPQASGSLSLSNLPGYVRASLYTGDYMRAEYVASETIGQVRVQGSLKGANARSVDATIQGVPKLIRMSVYNWSGMEAVLETDGSTSPSVDVRLKSAGREYVNALVTGLPSSLNVAVRPERAALALDCAFDLDASGPIPLLDLQMGKGARMESRDFLRGGSHWAGVDVRNPKAPLVDVYLNGIGDTSFCFPDVGGFNAAFNLGSALSDLRVSYQDAENNVQATLSSPAVGAHSVRQDEDGQLVYEGGGMSQLHVKGKFASMPLVFGRMPAGFSLSATEIPDTTVKVLTTGKIVRLDSEGKTLGRLDFNMKLAGPEASPPRDCSAGAGGFDLTIDASDFRAGHIITRISDQTRFNWPKADQRLVFRDSSEVTLGVDVMDFRGANLTFDTPFWELDEFKIMEGKSFHLTVDTVDHCASSTPQTLIGLGVSNMPDNLKAHIGAEGLMKKLSTTITAHDFDVSRIVVFAKIPGWPGYDFELTDIPKDVEVGVDVIVGAAVVNALRLPSGATLGGWRLTAFTDSTHYLSATYGNAQAFDYQADLDGGQTYAKVPRFFNARVGLADVSVQAQAGSYGMNIHGSSVTTGRVAGGIVVATALIGLTYAAIDTGHLFLDKAEETAGTLSAKFMDNTGGPYLMPVGMWLATS